MTTSVTRLYVTTLHKTCKTKTKTDFFSLRPRYSQKTIFNMTSVRHLEFEKFRFFFSNLHARNENLYLFTKFDRNRIIHGRYVDKAIFKMAAVRHLEFAKIEVLVTWPISPCDPSFLFQIWR